MKKRVITCVLALAVFCTSAPCGRTPVRAAEPVKTTETKGDAKEPGDTSETKGDVEEPGDTAETKGDAKELGHTMETAIPAAINKDYKFTWGEQSPECWNRITLPANGRLSVTANSIKGVVWEDLSVTVYDRDAGLVYVYNSDGKENVNHEVHTGLKKGTYYVLLKTQCPGYSEGITTTYRFGFKKDKHCELERNDTKETATPHDARRGVYRLYGRQYQQRNRPGRTRLLSGQAEKRKGLRIYLRGTGGHDCHRSDAGGQWEYGESVPFGESG